jgi:hypothetical protein
MMLVLLVRLSLRLELSCSGALHFVAAEPPRLFRVEW